ncbi:SiaB family protein kinase [Brumimicrobium mesophilum]|uniref:SiaB family protein kinase n=1 Tax=Brumimicrobium mesophilum TaxID=392717 RepID=UPI00131E73D4|nr:SiaB family protein kinase [Brumimicrobium mesophilum]
MSKQNEMQIDAKSIYQELHDDFTNHGSNFVVMSHFGEFSQDLVNSLSEGLEYIMDRRDVKRIITKRMFSIMIEGLQNIRLHSKVNSLNKKIGHVMIMEKNESYSVSFGNIVDENSKKNITDYLNKINNMNLENLKAYYLDILGNGEMTDKGGAGLGFTTISLKSKSKIKFQFINFEEDTCYFEMRVELL